MQIDDDTGNTDHLSHIPQYLMSSSLREPGWANTTVLRGDPVGEVRALKDTPGDDVGVVGSITLVHNLIAARLVDEYRLFVYPVVIGRCRQMFVDGADRRNLRLVETTPFHSDVLLLTCRPV